MVPRRVWSEQNTVHDWIDIQINNIHFNFANSTYNNVTYLESARQTSYWKYLVSQYSNFFSFLLPIHFKALIVLCFVRLTKEFLFYVFGQLFGRKMKAVNTRNVCWKHLTGTSVSNIKKDARVLSSTILVTPFCWSWMI